MLSNFATLLLGLCGLPQWDKKTHIPTSPHTRTHTGREIEQMKSSVNLCVHNGCSGISSVGISVVDPYRVDSIWVRLQSHNILCDDST